jgi:hypothetical protein
LSHVLGKTKASTEASAAALDAPIPTSLVALLVLSVAMDAQNPILEFDFEVIGIHTGNLGDQLIGGFLFNNVNGRHVVLGRRSPWQNHGFAPMNQIKEWIP